MENLCGTVLHRRLMIRSCRGRGSFTNVFSSNLKTVNLKIFANHVGIYIYTWRWSPDHTTQIWRDLFLRLIVYAFQRLCHFQPDLDILFVKITTKIGDSIEKHPLHIMPQGFGVSCKTFTLMSWLQSSFRFA